MDLINENEEINTETRDNVFKTLMNKKLLIAGVFVLCAAALLIYIVSHWVYTSYNLLYEDRQENVQAYSYYSFGSGVLKVASDSAVMIDEKNNALWHASYDMTDPQTVINGNTAAVYDKNGSSVRVFTTAGQTGAINTSLTINDAAVAQNGNVAVTLGNDAITWVNYYDVSGTLISTIKTTMEIDGYPYDISLSPNGVTLAVSYVMVSEGQPKTRIVFYNFGARGAAKMDNIVSRFNYDGELIGQVEFVSDSRCVAFATDGIHVFYGSDSPVEKFMIEAGNEISSALFDGRRFGMIVPEENEELLKIYNIRGRELVSSKIDFAYTSTVMDSDAIVLYNRNRMCVYSTVGVKIFDGDIEGMIRSVVPLKNNRFAVITEEGYKLIRLG